MSVREVKIIRFRNIGGPAEGYLSVAQGGEDVPFDIQRIFWTCFTPETVTRGKHAHHATEMVLVAVAGSVSVSTETRTGKKQVFTLDQPGMGLYLPAYTWHEMTYSEDAVQLVLASSRYAESDYIRDYDEFLRLREQP